MLDTDLIEAGTIHTQKVLQQIDSCKDSVQVVTNFFNKDMIDQLLGYCENTDIWVDAFDPNNNIIKHRQKCTWQLDTIIEVSHCVLENVTPILSNLFSKDLKFNGLDLWKDTAGYTISKHTDNPMFNASIQIYIKNLPYLSTVFEYKGLTIVDPAPGSGYIADNTTGISHWLDGIVPQDYNRYSLHATWT